MIGHNAKTCSKKKSQQLGGVNVVGIKVDLVGVCFATIFTNLIIILVYLQNDGPSQESQVAHLSHPPVEPQRVSSSQPSLETPGVSSTQ